MLLNGENFKFSPAMRNEVVKFANSINGTDFYIEFFIYKSISLVFV